MNFEDFLAPRQTRHLGISSNVSVRSSASRLSLRRPDRLSVRGGNTSNFTQCESQRLSPPPSDVWVRNLPATSTPKNFRAPTLQETQNLHRTSSTDSTKENTSSGGSQNKKTKSKLGNKHNKEDNKFRTNVDTGVQNTFKTPVKLPPPVFPVFVSPQKDRDTNSTISESPRKPPASPSPRKSEPSPRNSSKRGSRSSSVVLPIDSKGFCPTCQVPFVCVNVKPSCHTASCVTEISNEECPDGTACESRSHFHYRDYKHTALAEERALAGSDSSDVEIVLDERIIDNISVYSSGSKRKLSYADDKANKRTKNSSNEKKSTPEEEDNPFFNPSALEEENDENSEEKEEEEEEEPNPFLDIAELEEETGGAPEQQAEHLEPPEETEDTSISLPCIPGVCDSNQLAVTLTLTNPATGEAVKIQGIGGPEGWKKVDGTNAVDVAQCGCKHNLHIDCQNTQPHQATCAINSNAAALPGPSAKAMWEPLLKKMKSTVASSSASSTSSESSSSSSTSSLSEKNCPFYKRIPGTKFAVDAFNCGNVPGIKYYFLSHYHYDHYIGLTKHWTNIIYCSAITARLVKQGLKVRDNLIRVLEVDQTIKIDGVHVTPLDANHCPGSLMLLFQLSDGTNHLHTGDFRASPYMESYSAFWNLDVKNLYLDTTYCNKQYDFPTQEEVVNWAAERAEVNISVGKNCLFVCGSYTIGKEKIFLAIAEKIDCKIWAPASKIRVLNALQDPRISNRLTKNGKEAKVHVLPMNQISMKGMQDYIRTLKGSVTEIIAFRPSGWQYSGHNNTIHKLEQKGDITVCSLPYSEHSSYSELKRFVQFVRPREVIPTVRTQGRSWQQIKSTCQEWLRTSNASLNKAYNGSSSIQSSLKHWKKK